MFVADDLLTTSSSWPMPSQLHRLQCIQFLEESKSSLDEALIVSRDLNLKLDSVVLLCHYSPHEIHVSNDILVLILATAVIRVYCA